MKTIPAFLSLLAFALAFPALAQPAARPADTSAGLATICDPPHWAGIVPCITEDRDVVALHGKGLFADDLGHDGGRYYTDKDRKITLIVEIGTDHVIESVTIVSGLEAPEGSPLKALPVSKRIEADERICNEGDLEVGAPAELVRKLLGETHDIEKVADGEVLRYETRPGGTDDIVPEVYFTIRKGKIERIELYCGD
jgi:hypothetical protein